MSAALSMLIGLLPALFLLAALAAGRYPGERVLERLRARRSWPSRAPAGPVPRWARRARRRSGELLATALAGRGPPPAPACV